MPDLRVPLAVLSLTGAVVPGAYAEPPAASPPATLEQVADSSGPSHEEYTLRFEVAERIAAAFFECAIRKHKPRSIHILDQFGATIYAARMDGQFSDNIEVARLKAEAALYFRDSTVHWRDRSRADPLTASLVAQLGQFVSPVGLPILVEDQLLGAVGIGGASGDCAHEALTVVLGPQPPLEHSLPAS